VIVGCQQLVSAFAQTVNSAVQTGVDLLSEMLNIAYQQLRQAKPCHQLYQSDVNTLPSDENFDAVISAHMLEHLPNPAQGLREMVRVLRPDCL